MFETQVADLLQRAAGEYIRGIDKTALKISVLSGDVILRRLQLKPEAFERLNLPIDLTRGVVGSLRVKIPWAKVRKGTRGGDDIEGVRVGETVERGGSREAGEGEERRA